MRARFWMKPAAAVGLAALADVFFYGEGAGTTLGVFALALAACAFLLRPAILRDRLGCWAGGIAVALALVLADNPGFLGAVLFCLALAVAVLSPRATHADGLPRWALRFLAMGVFGIVAPVRDAVRVRRTGKGGVMALVGRAPILILPVVGSLVFLGLFTTANPILEHAFQQIEAPRADVARVMFWAVILIGAWGVLRPRGLKPRRGPARPPVPLGLTPDTATVGLSLIVFNLVFAVQNGLDVAFLWSGARLPDGLTLAQYAHRGAYPLILTALLAGLFVLLALRPGSETARRPLIRTLVAVWVAQNVFLVASSGLRTLDYIGAYSLTRFRIAALLWMGLVALGLVLILWRLVRETSSDWLIKANALAAGLVLVGASVVDLGAVAAAWNVTHARDAGGTAQPLDVGYLQGLDAEAAVSLAELERRLPDPSALRIEVAHARTSETCGLARTQADWRTWTWRGQRRLDRIEALGFPVDDACRY